MEIRKWKDYSLVSFRPFEDERLTRHVQDFLVRGYEKFGYRGFSVDVDDSFQDHSFYWTVLKADGGIAATIRLTHRRPATPLPIELAQRQDGGRYSFSGRGNIMELNSFIYTDPRVLQILFRSIYDHVVSRSIDTGFLLVDSRSDRYQKLYRNSGFESAKEYPETVGFDSFTWSDGTPVRWRIMEITRANIETFWGERRTAPRYETRLPAEILPAADPYPCTIVSLSENGARISFSPPELKSLVKKGSMIRLRLKSEDDDLERDGRILKISRGEKTGQARSSLNLHLAFSDPLSPSDCARIRYTRLAEKSPP